MRETRLSGSEGGGIEFNRFSLPLSGFCCAPAVRAKANARIRNVSVLRSLIATSRASRGLRKIDGEIIPKTGKRGANPFCSADLHF
jgi:hypothetical protein